MFEAIIVGAGPSGIGISIILQKLGINFTILERHDVGSSFLKWPKQMKLLTPSFFSNTFKMTDLNAITYDTSPALTLQTEHPSGHEYAAYLKNISQHFELPVQNNVNVNSVLTTEEGSFILNTSKGNMETKFLIWAAGEFQYPKNNSFPGAEHCIHNSLISDWSEVQGDSFFVIGGYESGMDTAINLAERGKRVTIIDSENLLNSDDIDPSRTISPYTKDRLRRVNSNNTIEFLTGRATRVERELDGEYVIYTEKMKIRSKTKPILATGFTGSLSMIKKLFHWKDGKALLNTFDESTRTPGLYVTGPLLQQHDMIFCFIYKFQQRFAVVANHIGIKLSKDVSIIEEYKKEGMFLDNLDNVTDKCAC